VGWFNTNLRGLTCWRRYECFPHLFLQNKKRDVKLTTKPFAKTKGIRKQKENLAMNLKRDIKKRNPNFNYF